MAEGFRGAIAGALRTIRAAAGETVTYRRGRQTASVSALKAQQTYQIERAGGVVQEWESWDFWIAVAELVLAGSAAEPRRGDRIIDADGAVYEVCGPGDAPAWRHGDAYRLEYLIHTQRVKE